MSKKNRASAYLYNNWWKLLLIALAVIMFWVFIMQVVSKPKPNERLSVTFVGANFSATKCQAELDAYVGTNTDQELRFVSVNSIENPTNAQSAMLVTVRTLGDTDFLVYEDKFVFEKDILSFYAPLTVEVKKTFEGVEQYKIDDNSYGFYAPESSRIYDYYKGDEKLVIFISSKCENMDGLNGIGKKGDDCALLALKHLLEVAP